MNPDPEGDVKISGDDRRESIEFHKQLEDERVHPLKDLEDVLKPIEEDKDFKRQNMPEADLMEYLNHEENIHWGNPQYNYEDSGFEVYISFNYSPWLYEKEDILLQGRMSYNSEKSVELGEETSLFLQFSTSNEFEPVFDENYICWISVRKNHPNPEMIHEQLDNKVRRMIKLFDDKR